jgi:hypothetical protein
VAAKKRPRRPSRHLPFSAWTEAAYTRLDYAVALLHRRIEAAGQTDAVRHATRQIALALDGHVVDVQYAAVLHAAIHIAETMVDCPDPTVHRHP